MHTNLIIKDIFTLTPKRLVTNDEIQRINVNIDAKKIKEKYGVRTRYWCDESENFMTLAKKILKKINLKYDFKEIDYVLVVTQSSSYKLPNISHHLISEHSFQNNIYTLDISQGCAGFIYALKLASSLRYEYKKGLIILGDTYSKILNMQDSSTMPIFGDGIAGIIVESNKSKIKKGLDENSFKFVNSGKDYDKLICSEKTQNKLFMNGPHIFNFVIKDITKMLSEYDLRKYDQFFLHQASKYTFDTLCNKLNIVDKSPSNLLKYGNLTSASIPFLLKDENFLKMKNKKLLFAGFGVGLSAGSCSYVC